MAPISILALGVVVLLVAGLVSLMAQVMAGRKALEVVLWAAAERGLADTEQWEVRAMAAFVFEKLPSARWLHAFMEEMQFEERCVREWQQAVEGYKAAQPRECGELFGDIGPW